MGILCVAHFLVDFLCAILVTKIANGNIVLLLLIYNFCAFALEMPLGLIIDGRYAPCKMAALGIVIVIAGYVFLPMPLLAVVMAGIGNALFHIGGGLSIMYANDKATPLGIFIAPGALGIYLGGFGSDIYLLFAILVALMCVIFLLKQSKSEKIQVKNTWVKGPNFAIVSLFLVVVLRGFYSGAYVLPKSMAIWVIVVTILGKVIGGYLSDRFGAYPVGITSLAVTTLCFSVPSIWILGLLGIFALQITMPITLFMLSQMTHKGFAFGLLTFGLFIGSLPSQLNYDMAIAPHILLISSILLFAISTKGEIIK